MKKYIIETYDLCKKGGRRFRVKDVNLAVPKGCIYGFLGPNGAGKTTTMKLLLGLIQPDGGNIEVLGQKMSEALNTVSLFDRKDDKVKNYSLGMKQRLGIAMALMGKPELIILDEPTNGLDPAGINEIRNLIMSIPEKYGSTVIISSHLLSEVEQIADYVGIINKGKMIYQGLLSELEIGDASLEEVFLEMTKGA